MTQYQKLFADPRTQHQQALLNQVTLLVYLLHEVVE